MSKNLKIAILGIVALAVAAAVAAITIPLIQRKFIAHFAPQIFTADSPIAGLRPVIDGNSARVANVEIIWQSGSVDPDTLNGDLMGVAVPAFNITIGRLALETATENGLGVIKKFLAEDFAFTPEPGKSIRVDGVEMRELPLSVSGDVDEATAFHLARDYASRISVTGVGVESRDIRITLDSFSLEATPPAKKGGIPGGMMRVENLILHAIPVDDAFGQYLLRNRKPVINMALSVTEGDEDGAAVIRIEADTEKRGALDAEIIMIAGPGFEDAFAAFGSQKKLSEHLFLVDARFTLRDDGFLDEAFDFLATAEGGGLSREQAIDYLFVGFAGELGDDAPETYAILEVPLRGFLEQGGSLEISLTPARTRSFADIGELFEDDTDAGMKSLGFGMRHIR